MLPIKLFRLVSVCFGSIETLKLSVLFRIVPKLVSVPVSKDTLHTPLHTAKKHGQIVCYLSHSSGKRPQYVSDRGNPGYLKFEHAGSSNIMRRLL
jgi:hypothetical protein